MKVKIMVAGKDRTLYVSTAITTTQFKHASLLAPNPLELRNDKDVVVFMVGSNGEPSVSQHGVVFPAGQTAFAYPLPSGMSETEAKILASRVGTELGKVEAQVASAFASVEAIEVLVEKYD